MRNVDDTVPKKKPRPLAKARLKILRAAYRPTNPALAEGTGSVAFPDTWQSRHGETSRASDGKFTLRVPGEQVVAVSQEVLSTGPVADITIEDVPLEDVIAELFAAQ